MATHSFDLMITEDDSVELYYTDDDLNEAAVILFGDAEDIDLDDEEVVDLAQQKAIDEYKGY